MQRCISTGASHHGRKSRVGGNESPRIWSEGTLMQIVPQDFVMFQYFKHQIACITMQYKAYQPP